MSYLNEQLMAMARGDQPAQLVLKHATYLNVFTGEFLEGDIAISDGVVIGFGSYQGVQEVDCTGKTVVPGFIDSHMHLESTMVMPARFAEAAIPHGTTAIITDPHEITNVCGRAGFDYIWKATKGLPLDVFLMVPSCVPASPFDESGCVFDHDDVTSALQLPRVLGLAELMDFPGTVGGNPEIAAKVNTTLDRGGIVDGHAPGLTGKALNAYVAARVSNDHECNHLEEGLEKLRLGQWVLVREGTASKDMEALLPLFEAPYAYRCALCTDDEHPGDLVRVGEIDNIIRKAIALGAPPANAYRMASLNGALCHGLSYRGAIAPGYLADLVVLNDPMQVDICAVYKEGKRVYTAGQTLSLPAVPVPRALKDTMHLPPVTAEDFRLRRVPEKIIGLNPGSLITDDCGEGTDYDLEHDILKLCVVERHHNTGHIGVCLLKGYGLRSGACAITVAHDSHNVIAVGTSDEEIAFAVNRVRELHGGMCIVNQGEVLDELPLPVAGLMSGLPAGEAADRVDHISNTAWANGVNRGIDPFMTLSFASLPVIPALKLTTLGVVDVNRFELV
ncbi:MAG: adenine deaminase [Clostridiales bacterium]|nr:adenine deaminase [Clostridiales bacterium]